MNRRWFVLGVIGILLVLNIWRWWPEPGANQVEGARPPLSGLADGKNFRISSLPPETARNWQGPPRNPFAERREREATPELSPDMVRLGPEEPDSSSEKPEEKEEVPDSRVRRKLEKYRLQGILVREGEEAVALLAKGSGTFSARTGKELEGGVVVANITRKAVVLSGLGGEAQRTLNLESN